MFDSTQVYGRKDRLFGPNSGFADPRFCEPVSCAFAWPPAPRGFELGPESPCLPEHNACGVLIGAAAPCDPTGVPEGEALDERWVTAVPSPFRPATTLTLRPGIRSEGVLGVFDASGRQVRALSVEPSSRSVTWDGLDDAGRRAAAGTYFLGMERAATRLSSRVTLIR